jgi:hypothetical protein
VRAERNPDYMRALLQNLIDFKRALTKFLELCRRSRATADYVAEDCHVIGSRPVSISAHDGAAQPHLSAACACALSYRHRTCASSTNRRLLRWEVGMVGW